MSTEESDVKKKDDLTGEDRFAWNVITSWISYLFVLIPGFIIPRLINDFQGTAELGIWDFCWAIANYLRFSGLGIGSSVSRYVAKFKAERDLEAMNGAVSTVLFIQLTIAAFVMLATGILSLEIPVFYADSLKELAPETRWVILFLGGSLVVYFAFDVFRGVTTGSHRWDVHNAIIACTHAVSFIGMATVLFLGGGLVEISFTYFVVTLLSDLIRVYYGYKVCDGLKISIEYVNWERAKEMSVFGIKTIMMSIPVLVVIQSTNIVVMALLGPALLAVLMRPISLIRHVSTFVSKYTFVLTPMAGSIQSTKDNVDLQKFVIDTTRYSVAFTLPIVIFLCVFGDRILHLWMGKGYADWSLIITLAVGYFLPISQSSTLRILVGLNAHGTVSFISIVVAIISYGLGILVVNYFGWNTTNAAILIATSLTLSQGVVIPLFTCSRLNISLVTYIKNVFAIPVICGVVYLVILVLTRIIFENHLDMSMLLGAFLGGLALVPMYWKWIAPEEFKGKVISKLRKGFAGILA